jgi:hypothetical protein
MLPAERGSGYDVKSLSFALARPRIARGVSAASLRPQAQGARGAAGSGAVAYPAARG